MRPDKAARASTHLIISRSFLLFSRPFQQLLQTTSRRTDHSNRPLELTVRGLVLGVAITLVFTAANVYLGLKVGLTFASSIPAAVISMALLRFVKSSTIEENNIVQTVASAAGTLSGIIFVLPGLVMVGWWNHFPFWSSFGICAIGGVLGVMYTIPLRRALVVDSPLPEIAKGVLQGRLEWGLITVGALIGVVLIVIDERLGKAGLIRLPPLAAGMGIYLPIVATAPIALGAISGWLYQLWIAGRPYAPIAKRLIVLLASGLIVGESLFGVFLAGLIVITNQANPLAVVGDSFQFAALVLGGTGFVAVVAAMFTAIAKVGRWASDAPANVEH
jgi:uncharacterized oligopeptide transporter (OPT) family protein